MHSPWRKPAFLLPLIMLHNEHGADPLRKEVPGHLFQFEEKIFGMTLPQLLSDLGAGVLLLSITEGLPLVPRLVLCVLVGLVVLLCVHASIGGYTLLYWLFLVCRSMTVPTHTVYRTDEMPPPNGQRRHKRPRSVQHTWIHPQTVEEGILGLHEHSKRHDVHTYWAVFQVVSLSNVGYLAPDEEARLSERFKQFLDGLSDPFPIKFLSLVDQTDPKRDAGLTFACEALPRLGRVPRLQSLQRENLSFQYASTGACTTVRHFIVVPATSLDVVRNTTSGGQTRRLFSFRRPPRVLASQVLTLLRTRLSVVTKLLTHLDVQATLLSDREVLKAIVSCLALGTPVPSFEVEVEQAQDDTRIGWNKRVRGLAGLCSYSSQDSRPAIFEPERISLGDLLAPQEVTVLADAVAVTAQGQTRYQRYFEVIDYGADLRCGWQEELTSLGLPLVLMYRIDLIDRRSMIKRLEWSLTRLESQRLADSRTRRITKADQLIEAEQIRGVVEALSRKRLNIFAVQMIIGIHASTFTRLEERSTYLLSHLSDLHIQARATTRRHDLGWQACQLDCLNSSLLDRSKNLPSDVLSTFMNWGSGVVGTPTGAFLGFTAGTGGSRRPLRLNPWDASKRLPNPHIVIVGETGMGKSLLAKVLCTGLMGLGIADVVVIDRDGDYDLLCQELAGECQQFDLARGCPVNPFSIPYAPADVDPTGPPTLLAEYIDNSVLVFLAMLLADETSLSKAAEAYLYQVVLTAYTAKGITDAAIQQNPNTLLLPAPTLADIIAVMQEGADPASQMQQQFVQRLCQVAHLFPTQDTTLSIEQPLTVFSIKELDEKWYPLMIYVVQNFLRRHRALKRDSRYLAYVIEEASYMLKHPAAKRYLESGSRGFRKLGIAQIVISQHPTDFLEEGQVVLGNAGTAFFLGMQQQVARKLHLPEELERVLSAGVPGQAVMRCRREYAHLSIVASPRQRVLFTTDPNERRTMRQQRRKIGMVSGHV